jgi:hypothetical protein
MKLKLVEFSSKQFTYTHVNKILVSEASDMENRHLQQIYDDACDVGFAVKSETTGNVVTYVMSEVLKNGEGEIEGWKYTPSYESIRKYPACADTKAIVFND